MILLLHVRITNAVSRTNFQIVVSRIVRQKRVSGNQLVGLGIWNLSRLALNRYGCGACCMMLYAMMLLGCTTYSSPVLRVIW